MHWFALYLATGGAWTLFRVALWLVIAWRLPQVRHQAPLLSVWALVANAATWPIDVIYFSWITAQLLFHTASMWRTARRLARWRRAP